MLRVSTAIVLALAAATGACGRLGLSDQGPETRAYESAAGRSGGPGESLQPLPEASPAVQSSTLPPLAGASQAYPPAGAPGYPPAQPQQAYPGTAAAPGAVAMAPPPPANAPVSSDRARALTMSDLAGDWALISGGDNCRITMSLTTWAGGRRAMSRGCTTPELQRISAWVLDGKQVVLKGSDGAMVASLYSAQPEQFAGTTVARQPITLSR